MKNYYFTLTFNLENSRVKKLLDEISSVSLSMLEFRSKSKFHMSYTAVMEQVHNDFKSKIAKICQLEKLEQLNYATNLFLNPAYVFDLSESPVQSNVKWEENCCAKLMYFEGAKDDPETSTSWLLKYEIYVLDDQINLDKGNFKMQIASMNLDLAPSTYQ